MKRSIFILLLIFLNPPFVSATTYEIEATGEYVMGDRDTKYEARRIALEHAKCLAVEKMGTYCESALKNDPPSESKSYPA